MAPILLCASLGIWLLGRAGDNNQDDNQPAKPAEQPPELEVMAADEPAFKEIVQNLEHDNVFTRTGAIKKLAGIKPNEQRAEVAQKLTKLLAYEDPFTRKGALQALAGWGTRKEVPALIDAMGHTDVFTRREALKVVGPFRDERALPAMIRCFRDFHTREDASTALRRMGAMAEKDMLALMSDNDVFLKVDVIKSLGDIGTETSVPALKAAAASGNVFLEGPAREALAAIAARAKL